MPHRRLHFGGRRRGMRGGGFGNFLSGLNKFAKDTKIGSTVANALGGLLPGKFGAIAGGIGQGLGSLGYGRRRRRHAARGSGLTLAGAGRRRVNRMRYLR